MKFRILFIKFLVLTSVIQAQAYLSNLEAGFQFPIYTTYASSFESTRYSTDEGYQLVWFDPEKGVVLQSEQSGVIGIAFRQNNMVKTTLKEFSQSTVITSSYSNLFRLYYYPFQKLRVEYFGLVMNSETLVLEVKAINESTMQTVLELFPYIQSTKQIFTEMKSSGGGFSFNHKRNADSWMKEHNIPYAEKLSNIFTVNRETVSLGIYDGISNQKDNSLTFLKNDLIKNQKLNNIIGDGKTAVMQLKCILKPGASYTFRIVRRLFETGKEPDKKETTKIASADLSDFVNENEKLFRNVPEIVFNNQKEEAVYWSAFNLMRQSMMGPEGKCNYNYYVFSREPKWGWGYGGQVFHESLTMLSYVYLDPISAMNSQRVYFERQHKDGYINYRTGPYLDEQIPFNSQLTSSAPWFNWQNYEIYKITRDKLFLKEAYESGKKFFEYYVSNRDFDKDGLCEWGADAVLESVRDARVAVWDEVGDPKNFESLDCNIMLVSEAKALAEMAAELGYLEAVTKFRKDALKRTNLINKFMWDEETGFYYNINKDDHSFTFKNNNDLKRKEIIAFLALWGGVADQAKAERLMDHFRNTAEFYRNYGVPTLSADDLYYNPIGYWNGPIWIPWQYLVFRGLLDYGYIAEAKDLTARITKNLAYQLETNHYFWEFYSADDLQAGWNKSYIWSGLIARFYIDLYKN